MVRARNHPARPLAPVKAETSLAKWGKETPNPHNATAANAETRVNSLRVYAFLLARFALGLFVALRPVALRSFVVVAMERVDIAETPKGREQVFQPGHLLDARPGGRVPENGEEKKVFLYTIVAATGRTAPAGGGFFSIRLYTVRASPRRGACIHDNNPFSKVLHLNLPVRPLISLLSIWVNKI